MMMGNPIRIVMVSGKIRLELHESIHQITINIAHTASHHSQWGL